MPPGTFSERKTIMKSEGRTLSVSEVMDDRPLGRFQIWTILLCGLVIIFDGFDTQSIGILAPSMSETLDIPLKYFGTILSAALFGLLIASLVMGPVADRFGRKWVLVCSVFTFALFMTLTARATSLEELVILRFLTGLGLGGAIPNAISLACEYAPKRLVPTVVGVIMAGMPLGQVLAGQASALLLPTRWGWRAVFYVGGILPCLVGIALILWLPESVRFLTVRGADKRKIARIMARISPVLASVTISPEASQDRERKGLPVKHLFAEGRTAATLLLWVPFFMNLLILYFIVSWLPALLRQVHMPISAGVAAATIFGVGSVIGSIAQGPMTNLWGPYALLLSEFGSCMLLSASLAMVATSLPLVMTVAFVLGFTVTGIQAGLNSLAASFYPTSIRSTGVGWALGIGRIGSVTGPMLGGILLKIGWTPQQILLATAVPAFCAGLAIMLSYRLAGSSSAYRAAPADLPIVSH
jgi:MFS transporter, AAHS family, 4-hydroxybenzoate transporter